MRGQRRYTVQTCGPDLKPVTTENFTNPNAALNHLLLTLSRAGHPDEACDQSWHTLLLVLLQGGTEMTLLDPDKQGSVVFSVGVEP